MTKLTLLLRIKCLVWFVVICVGCVCAPIHLLTHSPTHPYTYTPTYSVATVCIVCCVYMFNLRMFFIPEQFTVKAHPALSEGEGRTGGAKQVRNTFIIVYIHIHIQYLKTKL